MTDPAMSELLTRVRSAPDHGSPDRNMVAAENLSAAAMPGPGFYCHGCGHTFDGEGNQCDGCTNMFCRACYRSHIRNGCEDRGHEFDDRVKARARIRLTATINVIDSENKGTPRTRLPWEN